MTRVVYSRSPIFHSSDVLGINAVCVDPVTVVMSEPEKLFIENLPMIEEIIASIGRRKGMDAAAIEEFAADAKLRLISDDYAIIRAFRVRSSFKTYMTAVVARLLLDYRNREWGKWRASAEAERLGEVAVELERYLYRDGLTFDEAFAELAKRHPELIRAGAEALAARLRRRVRRRNVDLGEARMVSTFDDELSMDRVRLAKKLSVVMSGYIVTLTEEDQILLRLRFGSGMSVAEIARSLQLDQPVLYRRLYKLFDELRAVLGREGIAAADIADLIGKDAVVLDFHLKNKDVRPSEEEENGAAGRPKETP